MTKQATLTKAGNGTLVLEPTGGNNSIYTLSAAGGTLTHSGGTTTGRSDGTGAETKSSGILKLSGGLLSAPYRTINGNGSAGTLTVEGSGAAQHRHAAPLGKHGLRRRDGDQPQRRRHDPRDEPLPRA